MQKIKRNLSVWFRAAENSVQGIRNNKKWTFITSNLARLFDFYRHQDSWYEFDIISAAFQQLEARHAEAIMLWTLGKHVSQCWWMYGQDTGRAYAQRRPLNRTVCSVWVVLVWATQIKAHQGEQGATLRTWQLHTLCCFKRLFLHFCYDQYKTALVFMKLEDTYLLRGFTNTSNRLQSCGKLMKKYQGHIMLFTSSWARKDDTKFASTGIEIFSLQQGSLYKVVFFFLFAINATFTELIKNFAITFFQMAEANFEVKSPDLNIFCYSILFHFVVIISAFPLPVTVI